MDENTLAFARDLSLVLLALEAAILVAIPGVILWFTLRGVRAFKRWIKLPLLNAQMWALRIQHSTLRASSAAIALPIALESANARARATARGLVNFLRRL